MEVARGAGKKRFNSRVVREQMKKDPAYKKTAKKAAVKKSAAEAQAERIRRLKENLVTPKQAGRMPGFDQALAEEVLNPRPSFISKGQLSPGMNALLGINPNPMTYQVVYQNAPTRVHADGHEVSAEGRLILRKGFLIVAIFNHWDHFFAGEIAAP